MARQLKEIKNFNVGVVSNADSREIPDDGAIYEDNIDPNAPGGILKGYKDDILKGDNNWVDISTVRTGTGGSSYTKITTSTAHNLQNGDKVYVRGTTNNDGYFTVSEMLGTRFDINDAYVADENTTGQIKAETSDTYAAFRYPVANINVGAGASIGAGISDFVVSNGSKFKKDDIIIAGTGVFKINSVDGNTLKTTGPNYGTLTESAPFEDGETVYRTTNPVKITSYIDASDEEDLKTNLIIFDNQKIHGIEDIDSSSTVDTIGAGIDTIENSEDFGDFPLDIDFEKVPTVVNRHGNMFIGTGRNKTAKWLGKLDKKRLNYAPGFILEDSQLVSPIVALDRGYEKVLTYQFVTTSTTAEVLTPRIDNVTKVVHVGFIKDSPHLYLIDGDTGVTHVSENIGFPIGTIAKVTSCVTDLKVWVYDNRVEENGVDVEIEDLSDNPGRIHCYEIFDLQESGDISIRLKELFPLGFPLTHHQTIECEWGVGGDDIEAKGYKSNPIYKHETNSFGISETYEGKAHISDMIETVDSSGNGRLWMLASPLIGDHEELDGTNLFKGNHYLRNSTMAHFRFLWASYTDIDGDINNGTTSTKYFNDKSMPLTYYHDFHSKYEDFDTWDGINIGTRFFGRNDHGGRFNFSLMKRSIPATSVTNHTIPADNVSNGFQKYDIKMDTYDDWDSDSGGTTAEISRFISLVHGGSFWYWTKGYYAGNHMSDGPHTGNHSVGLTLHGDYYNVPMNTGMDGGTQPSDGNDSNIQEHQAWMYSRSTQLNSYDGPDTLGTHRPAKRNLEFNPYPNSLVDVSDLYDGVDHVVTCAVGIHQGIFIDDLWANHYRTTATNIRQRVVKGYRLGGLQGKMILWTSNAGDNNIGSLYTRSNSFGYRDDTKADVDHFDGMNLSTLCFDKTDDVVRNIKVIDQHGLPHKFLSMSRCKPLHEYNVKDSYNDNDFRHSGLFITLATDEDSSELLFIRLNTTVEQGDSIPHGDNLNVPAFGRTYELLGGAGSATGLAGYGPATDDTSFDIPGGATVTQNVVDNAGANDAIQQSPDNNDAVISKDGAGSSLGTLAVKVEGSHGGINDGTGEALNTIIPDGPGVLSYFQLRQYTAINGTYADSAEVKFGFWRKLYFNGRDADGNPINCRGHSETIPDDTPLFLRSENFQYIQKDDNGNKTAIDVIESQNGIPTGHSRWKKVQITGGAPSLFSIYLSGAESADSSMLSSPIITNVWGKGRPAEYTGEDATASFEGSTYGYSDYKLSLMNTTKGHRHFFCGIGSFNEDNTGFTNPTTNQIAFNPQGGEDTPSNNDMHITPMRHYLNSGTSKVSMEFSPVEEDEDNGVNSNFPNDVERRWKVSFEYDGVMESPLSNLSSFKPSTVLDEEGEPLYGEGNNAKDFKKMDITINLPSNISKRVSAIILYRQGGAIEDTEGYPYNKVKEIQLNSNSGWESFTKNSESYYKITVTDKMESNGTYSNLNQGISETLKNTSLNYSISAEVNSYLFVADFKSALVKKGQFSIVRSQNGAYSVFDVVNNIRTFSNPITALASFGGKLYVFTLKEVIRVNPDNLAIEDVLEGYGCGNKNGVVTTEYGMFFADKSHAYRHDGQNIKVISYALEKDLFSGQSNGWQDVITDTNFRISFISKLNLIAFVFKKTDPTSGLTGDSGCFTYHILKQRWDFRKFNISRGGTMYSLPIPSQELIESKTSDKIYYFAGPNTGMYSAPVTVGDEMITSDYADNGTFTNDNGNWAVYGSSVAISSWSGSAGYSGGGLTVNPGDTSTDAQGVQLGTSYLGTFVAGKTYRVSAKIKGTAGGLEDFEFGLGGATSGPFDVTTSFATYTRDIVAESDSALIISNTNADADSDWYIDDVSVKQLSEVVTKNTVIAEWEGGSYDGDFTWISKDLTFDVDTIDKRFIKLKIEASKTLVTTPIVYIDGTSVTLTSSGTNEWRINQKGKKMQIKLSSASGDVVPANSNTIIYSIGVVFRTTKVK